MKMSIFKSHYSMKLLNYIFKKMYMFSWQTREEYIYIYIYIERERERERVVLVDQKKDIQCGVCRNKETHTRTLYE